MLTPVEREKFMKALEDPTSELAQKLLGSEQLEVELEQPWWTENEIEEEHQSSSEGGSGSKARLRPEPIRIPQSMIKPVPHGHPLVYNLCAILYVECPSQEVLVIDHESQHRLHLHRPPPWHPHAFHLVPDKSRLQRSSEAD